MSALGIAAAALIILVVGGAIGYYLGRLQQSASSARLEEVESEFDEYRKQVTEHFSETADRFHAIGLQYRDLYEHLAKGSAALCALDTPATEPPFPLVAEVRDEDVENPVEDGADDEPVPEEMSAESSESPESAEAPAAAEAEAVEATDVDADETTGDDEPVVAAEAAPEKSGTKPDNVVELVRPAETGSTDKDEPESDERTYH